MTVCNIVENWLSSKLNTVKFFHTNTKANVQYDDYVSKSFTIKTRVKQGCVLRMCPSFNFFGIFISILLKRAFCVQDQISQGVKLHTRYDRRMCNPAQLKTKSKVKKKSPYEICSFLMMLHS